MVWHPPANIYWNIISVVVTWIGLKGTDLRGHSMWDLPEALNHPVILLSPINTSVKLEFVQIPSGSDPEQHTWG